MAFGLGRTVAELEESLSHREWLGWIAYHGLYDLPDDFLTTGQLGAMVGGIAGHRTKPSDLAPYYQPPPGARAPSNLGRALEFLKAHAPRKK